jgi:hypothetical protein
MPFRRTYNINPLVSGLAQWVGSYNTAKGGKLGDYYAQRNLTDQRAQIAQRAQTFNQLHDIGTQYMAQQNRIELENLNHANAMAKLDATRQAGVDAYYQKQYGTDYAGFLSRARDAGMSPGDFKSSLDMKNYQDQVNARAAAQNLEYRIPDDEDTKSRINSLHEEFNSNVADGVYREEEIPLARQQLEQQISELQQPQLLPKKPRPATVQEKMQAGEIFPVPGGYLALNDKGAITGIRMAPPSAGSGGSAGSKGNFLTQMGFAGPTQMQGPAPGAPGAAAAIPMQQPPPASMPAGGAPMAIPTTQPAGGMQLPAGSAQASQQQTIAEQLYPQFNMERGGVDLSLDPQTGKWDKNYSKLEMRTQLMLKAMEAGKTNVKGVESYDDAKVLSFFKMMEKEVFGGAENYQAMPQMGAPQGGSPSSQPAPSAGQPGSKIPVYNGQAMDETRDVGKVYWDADRQQAFKYLGNGKGVWLK